METEEQVWLKTAVRLRIKNCVARQGGAGLATHTEGSSAPCMKQAVAAFETTSRLFSVLTDRQTTRSAAYCVTDTVRH